MTNNLLVFSQIANYLDAACNAPGFEIEAFSDAINVSSGAVAAVTFCPFTPGPALCAERDPPYSAGYGFLSPLYLNYLTTFQETLSVVVVAPPGVEILPTLQCPKAAGNVAVCVDQADTRLPSGEYLDIYLPL